LYIFFFISSIFDFEHFNDDFLMFFVFGFKREDFSEIPDKFDFFKKLLFLIFDVFFREADVL